MFDLSVRLKRSTTAAILIPVRDEMVHSFPLQKSVQIPFQRFLARVCLESRRFPGVCIFEELLEGGEHLLPRLDLDRDFPFLLRCR